MAAVRRLIALNNAPSFAKAAEIAERTRDGAVNVVDTMDHFIEAMANVRPDSVKKHRVSLVPDDFKFQTVIDRFHFILERVLNKEVF